MRKDNKKEYLKIIIPVIILLVIVGFILFSSAYQPKSITVNNNLTNTVSFTNSFESPGWELNSKIDGSVFIYKLKEGKYQGQIIANFEIDQNDRMGILLSFYDCEVPIVISNVVCNYPQGTPLWTNAHGFYYDHITLDEESKELYIDRHTRDTGGSGIILVDFTIDERIEADTDLRLTIGAIIDASDRTVDYETFDATVTVDFKPENVLTKDGLIY